MRGLIIAIACGTLTLGPALAYGRALDEQGTFTASDTYAWLANGAPGDPTVRFAPGGTVTFSNPAGNGFHNLHFTTAVPTCPDVPKAQGRAGWSRTCTFDSPGTYDFVCEFHSLQGMTGRVIVEAPATAPTATPEGSATPVASATPGATATPAPPSAGAPAAPHATTLTVSLPARQRGTRVRGSARVAAGGSRLEVTVRLHGRRVGRWVKGSAPVGTVRFSVALSAKARPLAVTVTVRLTPPGGRVITHNQQVRLRR
jgi:hypothetical protein